MFLAFCFAFLCSLTVSGLVCRLVRGNATFLGLIDRPGERKIHSVPIPTGGGIGIGLGVLVPFALLQGVLFLVLGSENMIALVPELIRVHLEGLYLRSGGLWTLLGLGSVLLVLGILDDWFNLNWKLRLGVQTLVAMATVTCGWRFSLYMDMPVLTGVLSVLWIVGLINSFNMLDNMNGLSAGVAAISGLFLAGAMFLAPNPDSMQPQWFVGGLLLVLVGALAGFLLHNNPFRATMFMGDGGAYFIGFLLATSTLSATFSAYESPQTIFVPLVILAVPLYDTVTVLSIRIRNKKSLFVGDKNHFSHRLVDLGLSPTQAVLTIYLTTTLCCIGALLLYKVDFIGSVLIFLQTCMVLVLVRIMEHAAKK